MTTESVPKSLGSIVYVLMLPMLMVFMNHSMFAVALPAIRSSFDIAPDTVSWTVIAFALAFMMLMPLYGRLGDGLGKRRLLLIGITVFFSGTLLTLLASSLPLLFLGRFIQGAGAASMSPLCMALISEAVPANEKGKALGTWNSIGPVAFMVGPFAAGLMIDHLGWKTIFIPVLVVSLVSFLIVVKGTQREERPHWDFLSTFDWAGTLLLCAGITLFVFYISSRAITGISPLMDLRLLIPSLLFFAVFVFQEKRHPRPLVSLSLFRQKDFGLASFGAAARMFVMSSIGFLVPLYLSDIKGLSATFIGIIFASHSASIMVTLYLGGWLGDIWTSRWPVVISSSTQLVSMVFLALLPQSSHTGWFVAGLLTHGLGAGLSLAALHRSAMAGVSSKRSGVAAGLYGITRYGGSMLGIALAGTLLMWGLARGLVTVAAYQVVFWVLAAMCVIGVVLGWGLRR